LDTLTRAAQRAEGSNNSLKKIIAPIIPSSKNFVFALFFKKAALNQFLAAERFLEFISKNSLRFLFTTHIPQRRLKTRALRPGSSLMPNIKARGDQLFAASGSSPVGMGVVEGWISGLLCGRSTLPWLALGEVFIRFLLLSGILSSLMC
jgi:hypothetical protein